MDPCDINRIRQRRRSQHHVRCDFHNRRDDTLTWPLADAKTSIARAVQHCHRDRCYEAIDSEEVPSTALEPLAEPFQRKKTSKKSHHTTRARSWPLRGSPRCGHEGASLPG